MKLRYANRKLSCSISLQPIRFVETNASSARAFPVWPAKGCVLPRAVCRLAARIDNNGCLFYCEGYQPFEKRGPELQEQ